MADGESDEDAAETSPPPSPHARGSAVVAEIGSVCSSRKGKEEKHLILLSREVVFIKLSLSRATRDLCLISVFHRGSTL
jgi:hypothetical protein